jgi:epoxyqueuosine reductase
VNLTQMVKEQAGRLGFTLAGVTTPDPPPHFASFEAWLRQGRHGEMAYLASQRARLCREYPAQLLPECRSILVLGARYPAPLPHGRVASYAWGEDYHEVLPARLQAVVSFIEAQVGHPVSNRWYTDTGPVLERDLALRAGLGWIGKNTCLINPDQGSYFLLAEILLGLDLEPDPPFLADRCGTCSRCIVACPTGCILPDRMLDASRCISYLTIELKGAIPADLRPQMGAWVFGCDICQQVCPWNHFASPGAEPAFAPNQSLPNPDLPAELDLQPAEFSHKFHRSPVRRAKRGGYLRNVAVALGNSGSPSAVPALTHALIHDPEPMVRAHAAWALGQIGGTPARQALAEAAGVETDPWGQSEIRAAEADK